MLYFARATLIPTRARIEGHCGTRSYLAPPRARAQVDAEHYQREQDELVRAHAEDVRSLKEELTTLRRELTEQRIDATTASTETRVLRGAVSGTLSDPHALSMLQNELAVEQELNREKTQTIQRLRTKVRQIEAEAAELGHMAATRSLEAVENRSLRATQTSQRAGSGRDEMW